MKKGLIEVIVCMLLIALLIPTASATVNWTQEQKLIPPSAEGNKIFYFGEHVALQGDTALVATREDDVYVFTRTGTTWTQQAKLELDENQYHYKTVSSVSLWGDTALIGSQGSECVYVFIRSGTTWTRQAKIVSNSDVSEYFGCSVSLEEDTALIGADYKYEGTFNRSGAVYVYVRTDTTWTQQAKLQPADSMNDIFGRSVSLSGNTALISADWDDDTAYNAGAVYVYTRSGTTWTQEAKLIASDGTQEDYFGYSVSLSGNTALIGAYSDENGQKYGSAYVFTRSGTTWTQQAKLLAEDSTYSRYFGTSVSLSDDTALIGTQNESAYIFTRSGSTWSQQARLRASDGAENDYFGRSVSLSDNTALIGAFCDDDNGQDSGSAYVFTKSGEENEPPTTPPADDTGDEDTGTNTNDKGTPGFELIFVICAIAVSIALLKKKRKI